MRKCWTIEVALYVLLAKTCKVPIITIALHVTKSSFNSLTKTNALDSWPGRYCVRDSHREWLQCSLTALMSHRTYCGSQNCKSTGIVHANRKALLQLPPVSVHNCPSSSPVCNLFFLCLCRC